MDFNAFNIDTYNKQNLNENDRQAVEVIYESADKILDDSYIDDYLEQTECLLGKRGKGKRIYRGSERRATVEVYTKD